MRLTLDRTWGWIMGRRVRLLVLAGVVAAVAYAPVIPHKPYCRTGMWSDRSFSSSLSKPYVLAVTSNLVRFEIPFFVIKDRVFLRLADWAPSDDLAWVQNAMKKAVFGIATKAHRRKIGGGEISAVYTRYLGLEIKEDEYSRLDSDARKNGTKEPDENLNVSVKTLRLAWCDVVEAVVTPKD